MTHTPAIGEHRVAVLNKEKKATLAYLCVIPRRPRKAAGVQEKELA
jgi:hypothetical protein